MKLTIGTIALVMFVILGLWFPYSPKRLLSSSYLSSSNKASSWTAPCARKD
jgi:hypothetical protein